VPAAFRAGFYGCCCNEGWPVSRYESQIFILAYGYDVCPDAEGFNEVYMKIVMTLNQYCDVGGWLTGKKKSVSTTEISMMPLMLLNSFPGQPFRQNWNGCFFMKHLRAT
jgi:hypothetical protein